MRSTLFKAGVALVVAVVLLYASGVAPAAYNLIQDSGAALVRRSTINFDGAGVACADNAGALRTDCTIPGGGVTVINAAGSPAYRAVLAGVSNITVTGVTHGFNSANLQVACYDNSVPPAYFEPTSITIDAANYNVVITFAAATTGYCVIQGGGAVACEAYNITDADPAFIVASTTTDVALFTLPQTGKIMGVTIKHADQWSDGAGAMTDVSVSVGNAVAPFTQYAAAGSIGEVTVVADTTFYDSLSFKSTTMAAIGGTVSAHFISTGRNFGDGANTFLTGGSLMCYVCTVRIQ
jgi:hypothetical protein